MKESDKVEVISCWVTCTSILLKSEINVSFLKEGIDVVEAFMK